MLDTNKEKVMKLFYMRLKRLYVVYSTRVQIDVRRFLNDIRRMADKTQKA